MEPRVGYITLCAVQALVSPLLLSSIADLWFRMGASLES